MSWNWQCHDWPNFNWDRSWISAAEEQFLLGAGIAIGSVKHMDEDGGKPTPRGSDEREGRDDGGN